MKSLTSYEHFESVFAFWENALKPKAMDNLKLEKMQVYESTKGESWFGLSDAKAVIQTRTDGWLSGANKVATFAESLRQAIPAPKSIRRRIKWADQGDSLDIHCVWAGRLGDAWESHPRQKSLGAQSITLLADIGKNSGSHADEFFWRGAAVQTLSDFLTEANYNVEINAGMLLRSPFENDGDDSYRVWTLGVKSALAPLDKSALASVIALSGFFRVAGFLNAYRTASVEGQNASYGLGYTMPLSEVKDALREQGFTWDFDASPVGTAWSAKEWVIDAIKTLEGENS